MKYLADDGTIFETIECCEAYERKLSIQKLNPKQVVIPFADWIIGEECYFETYEIKDRNDLKKLECYYNNIVDDLYWTNEVRELFPYTAVVVRKYSDYAELTKYSKEDLIKKYEAFIKKLKES